MKQSRPFVIALLGLVLLCQACGRVESSSSVSVIGSGATSLSEGVSGTLRVGDVSHSSDELGIADLSGRASEKENTPLGVLPRRPVSYLDEVIPPCVPLEGFEQDTCPRITFSRELSSVAATTTLLRELPTFTETFLGSIGGAMAAPHIVVRATIIPDTARCDVYSFVSFDHDPDREKDTWFEEEFAAYICFVDARINEYIVGEGPPELTVAILEWAILWLDIEDESIVPKEDEQEAQLWISDYLGKELVMMLGPAWTTAVESWYVQPLLNRLWFVQRSGNEVRAVSEDTTDTDNPELLSQMNLSLDELVRKIREAAQERLVLTGGRIGVDSSLPMLVTDANKLQDFYQNTGAVYEGENATVLPPPVPGGDEPELPPTRTGEGEPDAATIPAPGDEASPTPTDDAPTPSSSTTTLLQAEDTSTTTTAGTTSTSTTSTTLPQTEGTLPAITTTSVQVPTGTTRPQAEDPAPTTTSTTAVPSDDTTGTTLPQAEDPVPTSTGTTVGSAPPPTGGVQPPGDGESGEPSAEEPDSAPAGGDGSGVGAG